MLVIRCPFLSYKCVLSVGHLSASCGVRDCDSDRRHHRKSVLPGERCPAEQVQGASSGEALCGGDGLHPGQSYGRTGDQSPGPGFSEFQRWWSSSRTRVSSTVAQYVDRKKLTGCGRDDNCWLQRVGVEKIFKIGQCSGDIEVEGRIKCKCFDIKRTISCICGAHMVYILFFRPTIFIERKAVDTIAYLCDGDARTGLNSLQLAVQAQVSANKVDISGQGAAKEVLVKEEHIKEGLQRSHILYDRAGMYLIYLVHP